MLLNEKSDIPPATKVDLKNLRNLPRRDLSLEKSFGDTPGLYSLEENGFRFDLLWHPKKNSDCLFVLFSGDALRKKLDPPVFQRWKWADLFPGHCLYISDPSLYLYERLGLAWYAGTSYFDPAPVIASIVEKASAQLGIKGDKVWTYGSSGGGFAALRMLTFLPHSGAITVNPQTSIVAYSAKSVEMFLRVCFEKRSRGAALKEFPDRISLLNSPLNYKNRSIIYLQNMVDEHHYNDHYIPFCASLGIEPMPRGSSALMERRTGNFHTIYFHHPEGHRKGETAEAFSRAIATASSWVAADLTSSIQGDGP